MFIVNDIDLLKRLSQHKILGFLLAQCKLGISSIRLTDYGLTIKREIEKYQAIVLLNVDDGFAGWSKNRSSMLSLSDMSSIYIAKINVGSTLVISEEDLFLKEEAVKYRTASLQFDEFIIKTIKDEKLIQLYNYIKVA